MHAGAIGALAVAGAFVLASSVWVVIYAAVTSLLAKRRARPS